MVLGCDAEEVIVANQQIENNQQTRNKAFKFEYRSGAIENIDATDPDTFWVQEEFSNIFAIYLKAVKRLF